MLFHLFKKSQKNQQEDTKSTTLPKEKKMQKHTLLAKGAIVLMILKIALSTTALYVSDFVSAGGVSTSELLNCTNYYRSQAGLAPLVLNPTLSKAALKKIDDMDSYNYWAHTNPHNGVEPWHFFEEANYDYAIAGENLAFDYNTSDGVCQGWMNSQSHRENLLHPKYQEVGFAVRRVDLDKEGEGHLVVQFFGTQIGTRVDKETQENYRYKSRNVVCQSEILNTLKVTSPECGYINDPNVHIEAEIFDSQLAEFGFKINDSDLNGKVLEEGSNRVIRAEKKLPDGEYTIATNSPELTKPAVVSITVDTQAPEMPTEEISVQSETNNKVHIFDIELPIYEENFESAEIFYKDALGETTSKTFQLLGNHIYHTRISFLADPAIESYNATITAIDKANNSNSVTLDLYLDETSNFTAALGFIDFDNVWKYIAMIMIAVIALVYALDVFVFHNAKTSTKNHKESKHHKLNQLIILVLILFALINFF